MENKIAHKIKLLLLLPLVLTLTNCTSPKATGPLKTVTISSKVHSFMNLPAYVASAKGFFAEEGILVRWQPATSDNDVINQIVEGKAAIGLAAPGAVAFDKDKNTSPEKAKSKDKSKIKEKAQEPNTKAKNKQCVVVGSYISKVPYWALTYGGDAFRNRFDLERRIIAVEYPPAFNYALVQDLLINAGRPIKATLLSNVNIEGMLAAIKSGKANIAVCEEPTVSVAFNTQKAKICGSFSKEFGDFAYRGIVVSEPSIATNAKDIQGVVNALTKAVASINNDPESAVQALRTEFPELGEAVIRDAVFRLLDIQAIPANLNVTAPVWEKAYGMRRQIGELHSEAPFKTHVDMSFVEKAPKLEVNMGPKARAK
jgi:NitT/TauT family transport system substrate-binding protein